MRRLKENWVWWLGAVLLVNSGYLFARNDASIPYVVNVVLHAVLGVGVAAIGAKWLVGRLRDGNALLRLAVVLMVAGIAFGFVIFFTGATRPFRWIVHTHLGLMAAGVVLLPFGLRVRSGAWRGLPAWSGFAIIVTGLLTTILYSLPPVVPRFVKNSATEYGSYKVVNPALPPATMEGETAGGSKSPFFPSAVETSDGKFIDSKFFMESETCGESGCHPDIFAMWSGSMHKFSSFNNQWYRRSITYMQEMQGQIESSKWCAGCHDPAVLLTGRWTKPMSEQLDMPEAHAGLGCAACHSIAHVKNTMGNSGVVYEYPPMHRFVDTGNPLYKAVHDFITKLDPAPHRETFLKPFHTEQSSEFCSSCHKVHLDEPVNNFRWVRGFNEYDAWQGSGVSGMGSLSFYYPPSPKGCVDCHMPLVESRDKGNKKGMVHSHRFPAANTAVPYANLDREQFNVTEAFLKANIVTLDIFGMTIGEADDQAESYSRGGEPTTFSMSGDESGLVAGLTGGSSTDAANLIAPLDEVGATIRRGDSARLSVVVRTRGVGHRFPGGTFDAFDVWVELEMRDKATNALVYHSGGIEPDGRVDRGAHFYRAIMLDANGNVIDKRNAFAARTLLYARGIPPGAADTVHFRLNIPKDAGDELVVNARLHYRKFMDFNTKFAFAGVPADDAPHDENYDDRAWQFTGDTTGNAGKINGIPDLPTITIAEDSLVLKVLPSDAAPIEPRVVETKALRERWNDYGIGLLLQGDLKGARAIFERVTRIEAEYADGWVNVARVALREGDLDNAETNLREAIRLLDKTPPENPHRAKAHYFLAQVHKARGDLDDAMAELTIAVKQYPNDRNIRNSIGRTLYLKRDFKGAIASYEKTLAIDPEDLTAHYNMMQAYRGLGNNDKAREHQTYFMRFKADESVQAISGHTRRKYPDLNLERQAIREHYQMEMPSFSPKEYGGTIEVVTAMSKK